VKKIWCNIQGKYVSVPPTTRSSPPRQSKSQFLGHIFAGRVRFGGIDFVVLDRLLRATTKKGRQLFLTKKVHPRDKILATPMNFLSFDLESSGSRLHLQNGQVSFVYQGHRVKVKVTGATRHVILLAGGLASIERQSH